MNKFVQLPEGMTENDVLKQVSSEYNASFDFVNNKRTLFRNRQDLYVNNKDQKNKVYVRLVRSVVQTLMSLYYLDKKKVKFSARKFGGKWQARNLDDLANFDYDEMNLSEKKYLAQWNKFMYGPRIEIKDMYDKVSEHPRTKVVNPMSWVPDLNFSIGSEARYHGFEMEVNESEIDGNMRYNNTEYLLTDKELTEYKKKLGTDRNNETQMSMDAIHAVRNLGSNSQKLGDNRVYSIYYHYTILNGEKYLTVTGNDKSLLLACEKIEAVREEEKKDPSKIPFPVVVGWYEPLEGDPYGICIPDIMEDKQRMQQLFMNLNRIKAENEARGDFFVYDDIAIKNINEFKIPTHGPKYIKADLQTNPNPIREVEKARVKPDSYNMPQVLQGQATLDVGLDERSLGVSPEGGITATENQRVQKNANLRLVLGSRIDNRAEKKFRDILWYRVYQEFFRVNSEKNIRINSGLFQKAITLKKKDFITQEDIDVDIVSESEQQEIDDKERAGYNMLVSYALQNPESSKFSKNFALRKLYMLNGVSEEEANILVPQSSDEITAWMDLELLNRNESPIPEEMSQDHLTFISIYQNAFDTKAKRDAIAKRMEMYRMSGQQAKNTAMAQQMATQGTNDNIQSQLTSNNIQTQNSTQAQTLGANAG